MSIEENRANLNRIREQIKAGEKELNEETKNEILKYLANYHVGIKVVSQEGTCVAGHRVNNEWITKGKDDGWKTPAGICMFAYSVLYPHILMLMYGGSFPWESDPDIVLVPCPDSQNPVVFELKRMGGV